MWPDDSNWQMTVLFLLALALMGFVMKFVVLLLPATIPTYRPHVFWLLLSPASNRRLRSIESIPKVLLRTVLLCGALVLTCWIYWNLLRVAHVRGIALSYGAVPVLLLMSETFVAFASVLWLPSGRMLPPIHDRPWRARSVADFWGNRWNLWFSDWSRYAIFQRLRRRPVFALVLAFAVSGLLHEWVINVPLYFVTGRVLFGTILLYFLIQAVGVLVERRFKSHPACMIVFTWLVVVAPVPLVLNEGLLRTLHLWPEAPESAEHFATGRRPFLLNSFYAYSIQVQPPNPIVRASVHVFGGRNSSPNFAPRPARGTCGSSAPVAVIPSCPLTTPRIQTFELLSMLFILPSGWCHNIFAKTKNRKSLNPRKIL